MKPIVTRNSGDSGSLRLGWSEDPPVETRKDTERTWDLVAVPVRRPDAT